MSKARSGPARMSQGDLQQYLDRHPSAARGDALALARGEPVGATGPAAEALAAALEGRDRNKATRPAAEALGRLRATGESPAKPPVLTRTGPSPLAQIIANVKSSMLQVRVIRRDDGHPQEVILWFAGAQLMSQNQLISALQKNIKSYFGYKKSWKTKMALARQIIHADGPCQFVDPVKIEVLRQSRRLADRDGLTPQFKILIDELRVPALDANRQPDPARPAVILDDNPFRVVDVIPYQRQVRAKDAGTRGIGLRLVACPGWLPEEAPDPLHDWLGLPRTETP